MVAVTVEIVMKGTGVIFVPRSRTEKRLALVFQLIGIFNSLST